MGVFDRRGNFTNKCHWSFKSATVQSIKGLILRIIDQDIQSPSRELLEKLLELLDAIIFCDVCSNNVDAPGRKMIVRFVW